MRLFDAPVVVDGTGHPAYDVAPDGKRFLMIQLTPANRINVVLNWTEVLRATPGSRRTSRQSGDEALRHLSHRLTWPNVSR